MLTGQRILARNCTYQLRGSDITGLSCKHRRTGQGGREGSRPPWIWETSKIRADGMGNSGIQGTEIFLDEGFSYLNM